MKPDTTILPSKHSMVLGSIAVVVLVGLLGSLAALGWLGKKTETRQSERQPLPDEIAEQVRQFCGTACHRYPTPESFPREHWRSEVERGYSFFESSGLPLTPPPLESVVRYYEQLAPEQFVTPTWPQATTPPGTQFTPVRFPGPPTAEPFAISNVNLVHLPDPNTPKKAKNAKPPLDILACDMRGGLVMLQRPYEAQPQWRVLGRVSHPAKAEVVDLDGDGIMDVLVANLGNFGPTDRRCGSVVWLRGNRDGSFTPITLLSNVGRVADVRAADFRGTGKLDLVVAVFGWQATGELLLLENHTTDWSTPRFVPRTLDRRHGTIHVPVIDLNGDGKPDFVALIAQEHETVVAFINLGNGQFRSQTLYTAPHPGYGSSGIELVDLDDDGLVDVLLTNGDSLDKPYLFKPYHGVQWLKNKGSLRFDHHAITPMYGVHRAVAADLRNKGKKDIVAVSFLPDDNFPQRRKNRPDSLIVLEQSSSGKDLPRFSRHSLAHTHCDHVTCAVGDVFGSGRNDIVLGNFSTLASAEPVIIYKNLGRATTRHGLEPPFPSPAFSFANLFRATHLSYHRRSLVADVLEP